MNKMDDLISRQAAIDAADKIIERDTSGNNDVVKAMTAWKMYVEALPSVQPDHIAEVSKKDIPSVQPKQAAREMKAEDVPEINVGKMHGYVFKRLERAANGYYHIVYDDNGQEYEGYSSFSIDVISDYLKEYFFPDVRILKKQVSILADALNGCPLTDPCDRLWAPHGWCEEHCREKQFAPSKECWLKYAEVMASEG